MIDHDSYGYRTGNFSPLITYYPSSAADPMIDLSGCEYPVGNFTQLETYLPWWLWLRHWRVCAQISVYVPDVVGILQPGTTTLNKRGKTAIAQTNSSKLLKLWSISRSTASSSKHLYLENMRKYECPHALPTVKLWNMRMKIESSDNRLNANSLRGFKTFWNNILSNICT